MARLVGSNPGKTMSTHPLDQLLNLRRLSTKAAQVALAGIRQAARAADLPELDALAASVEEQARQTADLEQRWSSDRGVRENDTALDLDRNIDALLTGLRSSVEAWVMLHGDDHPHTEAVTDLGLSMFPEGLAAHTELRWTEQSVANDRLVELLRSSSHADAVSAVGLGTGTDRLAELQARFAAALARERGPKVTFEAVRESRASLALAYGHLVAAIRVETGLDPDGERRDALLAPVLEADRAAFQKRRAAIRRGLSGVTTVPPVDDSN